VVGPREYGNECSDFIEGGEFIDSSSDCQLLKKVSARLSNFQ